MWLWWWKNTLVVFWEILMDTSALLDPSKLTAMVSVEIDANLMDRLNLALLNSLVWRISLGRSLESKGEWPVDYLDTWSGFEAAKTAPWMSRRLHHLVNSLSPRMSELVEDAVASWCGDIVGYFWLIRNELQKFVELKFEFFSFNTFYVFQIFW